MNRRRDREGTVNDNEKVNELNYELNIKYIIC